MEEKNKGGRPPKYTDANELAAKIDEYFDYILGEKTTTEVQDQKTGEFEEVEIWLGYPERINITGLALFLGFADKSTLYEYKKKPKFFAYSVKRGISKIEQQYESNLYERNSTGAIFALKNFGWRDKTEVDIDHTTQGKSMLPIINIISPDGK